jgi:hypothetical protein
MGQSASRRRAERCRETEAKRLAGAVEGDLEGRGAVSESVVTRGKSIAPESTGVGSLHPMFISLSPPASPLGSVSRCPSNEPFYATRYQIPDGHGRNRRRHSDGHPPAVAIGDELEGSQGRHGDSQTARDGRSMVWRRNHTSRGPRRLLGRF